MILSAFATGQAIQINNGVIHPAALGWLGLAIITLLIALRPTLARRFGILARVPLPTAMAICIAIQLIELIYWDLHWNSQSIITIAALLIAGAATYLMWRHEDEWKLPLVLMLIVFATAGVMTIRSMPNPIIDVYWFQQDSSQALLNGQSPYAVRFHDLYHKDLGFYGPGVSVNGWLTYSFPYPPLTLLLDIPGRLLGDIRFSHLAALTIAAGLLVLAVPGQRAVLAAMMMLFTPRSLLVIKAAWTEPMVVLLLTFTIFIAVRAPKHLWMALGLLLAIKQYMVLALPLISLLQNENLPGSAHKKAWPALVKALALAAMITFPFMLWSPTSFVRSVMLWQFRQPFRTDSLSYPALISRTIGGQPGVWISLLAAGSAIVLARQTKRRGVQPFASAFAFVMLVFFATSKQAFCNYYFMVIGAMCTAIAMSGDQHVAEMSLITTDAETEFRRIAA